MKHLKLFEEFSGEISEAASLEDIKALKPGKAVHYLGTGYRVIKNDGFILDLVNTEDEKDTISVNYNMFKAKGFINESSADEYELRKWLVDEIGVKPYHIENYIFMRNGKDVKGEIMAMWLNKKNHEDLRKWIMSVAVPASKTLSYIKE
jgi:hypothetical protein